MPSQRASGLSEADRELVARSLKAAVAGSYFPDWEVSIITGFSRKQLAQVSDAWPEAVAVGTLSADPDEIQEVAVNNVLNNLIGYPHGQWDRLKQDLGGADEDRLIELLSAWRGEAVAGYFDALE